MDKLTLQCVRCNSILRQVEVRTDRTVIFSCSCGMLVSLRQQEEASAIDWRLCDTPVVYPDHTFFGNPTGDYYPRDAGHGAGMAPPGIPTAGLPRWKPKRTPAPDVELEGGD